jgi:hypothetical protein
MLLFIRTALAGLLYPESSGIQNKKISALPLSVAKVP